MNCNCITETENQLSEKLKGDDSCFKRPRNNLCTSISAKNIGLNFKTGKTMLGIPFNVYWDKQRKPSEVMFYATFCPFCGKPTRKEDLNPDDIAGRP
jgi:hypothetical protein